MSKKSDKQRKGRLQKTPVGDAFSIDSIEQLKAIASPLRQQLLEQFAIEPATTKQIALKLGHQPTRLYHHVSKLENAGLIRLVDKKRVRGTTEKYYSAVATKLAINPQAFEDHAANIASEITSLGILESLFTNVRTEVAEFLAEFDKEPPDPCMDPAEQPIIFMQAEVDTDEATVRVLREKINQLIAEFESLAEKGPDDPEKSRKHRLILGWYPRARSS